MATQIVKVGNYTITVNVQSGGGNTVDSDLNKDGEYDTPWYHAMRAVEDVILGHAAANVNVEGRNYVYGIERALEDIETRMCHVPQHGIPDTFTM